MESRPAYLVAELTVRDISKLLEYAAKVQPLMARYGGRIVAITQGSTRVIEGDWRPDLVVVHRWDDAERFDRFWASAEYAPLKDLRHEACESRIVMVDAFAPGPAAETSDV